MDFITHVEAGLMAALPGIVTSYSGQVNASSLSEMEVTVKKMTHELGNVVMKQWLEAQDLDFIHFRPHSIRDRRGHAKQREK